MTVKVNNISLEVVLKEIDSNLYSYGWINTYDDLILIPMKKVKDVFKDNYKNLIEAKLFSKKEELSLIPVDESDLFSMVKFSVEDNMEYIEEIQMITKYKSPFAGGEDGLIIKHYIDYDNEGQAFIYYTKLDDIIKGAGVYGKTK